jgi:hypothetical protein
VRADTSRRELTSPNVVAVLPGSDPALRDELVVCTAHLDHVGIGAEVDGDTIYNGFYDNAMGSAMVLEMARVMAASPVRPRRSIVFLLVTGEERGLLGSDYFAQHPSVPGQPIVANVNLDMPLFLHPVADLVAFGAEHSTLGELARAAAETNGFRAQPGPRARGVDLRALRPVLLRAPGRAGDLPRHRLRFARRRRRRPPGERASSASALPPAERRARTRRRLGRRRPLHRRQHRAGARGRRRRRATALAPRQLLRRAVRRRRSGFRRDAELAVERPGGAARRPARLRVDEQLRSIGSHLQTITTLVDEGDEQLGRRAPQVSGWSVAEQLDHATKVLERGLGLIAADPPRLDRGINLLGRLLLRLGRLPRGVGKSPAAVRGEERSAAQLREAVARIRELLERTDDAAPLSQGEIRSCRIRTSAA